VRCNAKYKKRDQVMYMGICWVINHVTHEVIYRPEIVCTGHLYFLESPGYANQDDVPEWKLSSCSSSRWDREAV
jgi:hypothetical protein